MKKKKFNIFKTFEVFNTQAVSVIKDRVIKFVLVEAENFFASKSCIQTTFDNKESMNMFIYNNKKVYNLLTSTWARCQEKRKTESLVNDKALVK